MIKFMGNYASAYTSRKTGRLGQNWYTSRGTDQHKLNNINQ